MAKALSEEIEKNEQLEKQNKELQEENEGLRADVQNRLNVEVENIELKKQIEKMKRCANCKKGNYPYYSISIDEDGRKTFHNWNEEKGDYCNTGYKGDYKYCELAE